ncbi:MAG: ATP-binding protein [Pseudomonadota bacterium]
MPAQDWPRRWRHSLRLRLITVFLLLALGMSAIFLGGMQRAFSNGWRDAARPLLIDYVDRLAADIGTPPSVERAQALVARLPIAIRIEGQSVNWQSHPDRPDRPDFNDRRGWLDDDHADPRSRDWLSRSTADGHRISFGWGTMPWRDSSHQIGWVMLVLLLGLIAVAYRYVRRLLKPLDDIRAGAERFGAGVFDKAIPLRRRDELGELAQRINTMAHDIEAMLNAKRALLLALSHELRSPLTRARLNAELLPTTADGNSPGEAERAALLRDLGEMRDLISDLLESERLASPHAALLREKVELAALVRDTVADMPGASSIELDLPPDLPPLQLDRTRMRLLVRNLADNALRYSAGTARPPRISLSQQNGGVLLEVRDFGAGVDAAQLARLSEPFYRTDSARQRATGGVGLGLYLCQLVAKAHGSQLELRNAEPGLGARVLFVPGD